jgi:hypothetical protein
MENMGNLTWTGVILSATDTYWSCEIGKLRFVIHSRPENTLPFYGVLSRRVDNEYVLLESGHYKTLSSAKSGLKRRAKGYRS